jgi:hypothetical protein
MFIKPSLCGLFVTAAMVSAGVAGSAQAGVAFVPEATVEVGVLGDTSTTKVGLLNTANPNQFSSSGQWDNANWDFTWDMTVDLDPFINGVFGVTNNTGSTQTFILNVTIPVAPPVTPSSVMGGSVGGSVTDANNDGVATVANSGGSPLFDGLIDGSSVLSIIGSPYAYSAPFAGGTANIPATNVGLPGPTIPGPAALSTIGISHVFTLTPGDTVSLTSFFIVEVPEPASLGLLACGMALVGLKRRH